MIRREQANRPGSLGALLVAVGLRQADEHALISLLALNGLRVSEAIGADIEALGIQRGHRTLVVTRKGSWSSRCRWHRAPPGQSTWPPAIAARARSSWHPTGAEVDRHGAARIVRCTARQAEIGKNARPHTLRYAFITAALDAGVPLRDVQEAASHADPRTTMRYDRARTSLDRYATYIVLYRPHTSRVLPDSPRSGIIRLVGYRPGGSPAVTSPAAREPPIGAARLMIGSSSAACRNG